MNTRNPVDPQNPRVVGDAYSAPKQRPQRRPLATRTANAFGVSSEDQKSVAASAVTPVARFDARTKAPTGAAECIEYKGYDLKIEPQRSGWKVAIFPKGSPFALHRMPYTTEFTGRDDVVAQGKAIVDELTADKTLPKLAIEPAESPKSRSSSPAAWFHRFRRSLSQGWATLKRAYFSVDQPPRAGS